MTFGVPFWLHFSTFSKNRKTMKSMTLTTFWKVFHLQKPLIFRWIFHHFSCFFRNPPGGRFWRVPEPIFSQKCGFGAISGFRWGPKSAPGRAFPDRGAPARQRVSGLRRSLHHTPPYITPHLTHRLSIWFSFLLLSFLRRSPSRERWGPADHPETGMPYKTGSRFSSFFGALFGAHFFRL